MRSSRCSIELNSSAKINLSLAILGRRPDGFHALHSVVAQTVFGDKLQLDWDPSGSGEDSLQFENADLPLQENTLWQALQLFRGASNCHYGHFKLRLEKYIPIGAGLGGGSSNGVAVLRGLRQLARREFPDLDWQSLAEQIGSDCPLFLHHDPLIMEGRGEQIAPLEHELSERIKGEPVILFKPGFSINTSEAYARLAATGLYQSAGRPAEILSEWRHSGSLVPPVCNNFEQLLRDWMPSLAIVLKCLRNEHGLDARLSGSGSACFVFPDGNQSAIGSLREVLEDAWGNSFWIQQTFVK